MANQMMGQAADASDTGDDQDDFTVCITISGADGSITVGPDNDDDESDDGSQSADGTTNLAQTPSDDDSGMQPAQSIKQALSIAGDMLKQAQQSMGGGNGAVMAAPGGADQAAAASAAFAANRGK